MSTELHHTLPSLSTYPVKMIFKGRYNVLFSFGAVFIFCSFLVRLGLLLVSLPKIHFGFSAIIRLHALGLIYDIAVALFLVAILNLYLLILPSKWCGSKADKIIIYSWLFLLLLISFFSFFAEVTFWQEFESRLNFIAVDYLIYTYEVIHNISESYPLPLLIGGVVLVVVAVMWFFSVKKIFLNAFNAVMPLHRRAAISGSLLFFTVAIPLFLSNSTAETGNNRYQNELSKAGIYSFFAAFKNNELNYNDFYAMLTKDQAYRIVRSELKERNSHFLRNGNSIKRRIVNTGPAYKPNVIMITVESLSADFLRHFGNKQKLMPVLDSLAEQSMLFTNMYATGTRTVRGMEALTLSAPPTPGSSIVRRQHNENLTTIGHIFEQEGYHRTFYYGGDGYFDNMNEYFGSNGFDITDRGRNMKMGDNYHTKRTIIANKLVRFENAWGISDEDLYDAVLRGSDQQYKEGIPFYNFVMTTSNHRPYTYPSGEINMPSGSSREGAVRYTDYAIGKFLAHIKLKPWYKNTVVIIVADHCASSAGKNEIDIRKYHIPCMILNLPSKENRVISKMCSQIDLYPTLFSVLGWTYESNLYGKNVLDGNYQSRAILGTYQKLAYLRQDSLVILGPQQKTETFLYDAKNNEQIPAHLFSGTIHKAIANYQTAYDLFKNGGMHQ
jgi:phosphoglycerol transferase MdoB-like AlkP superfamily enzyme